MDIPAVNMHRADREACVVSIATTRVILTYFINEAIPKMRWHLTTVNTHIIGRKLRELPHDFADLRCIDKAARPHETTTLVDNSALTNTAHNETGTVQPHLPWDHILMIEGTNSSVFTWVFQLKQGMAFHFFLVHENKRRECRGRHVQWYNTNAKTSYVPKIESIHLPKLYTHDLVM